VKLVSDLVLWRWIDIKVIDGFVNQIARVIGRGSDILRRVETGVIQNYALSIIFGVVVLVGYFLWR
jgi:NADH-quinone oxidoreductase subunit L